ncbi:MAG TPA: response regulator transcription factor [Chloroflexota bacterium]|nr:response regulator transcription factor [Chloroflexota bacterium]
MKILLAEDDADMLAVTAYALRREGFKIIVATDGAQALHRWRSDEPDLILLDVGMPRVNGFEVCRRIRQTANTPVIMLTAAGDEDHVVQGYMNGADDYVTKPFSPKQLALRIRAVLRRSRGEVTSEPSDTVQAGGLLLDVAEHRAHQGAVSAELTPLEFRILYLLATNLGRVVSFARLVEYAWGYQSRNPSMLKTHVSHIRKKLGLRRGQPGDITVVNGVGYSLSK